MNGVTILAAEDWAVVQSHEHEPPYEYIPGCSLCSSIRIIESFAPDNHD